MWSTAPRELPKIYHRKEHEAGLDRVARLPAHLLLRGQGTERDTLVPVIDQFAKEYLLGDLRWTREAMLGRLDGLSEYDVRRPLTITGTNLLGLVKHLTLTEARYLGEIFSRPFPELLPRWDDHDGNQDWMWAAEHETRTGIIGRYRRACEHSDATVSALPIEAPGHVPWWPRPDVKLFNVMVHVLTETSRHAGHADILREQLDGTVGAGAQGVPLHGHDAAYWESYRARIEQAAKTAAPAV
jgi:Protein of unknown function (DUF664)